MVTCKLGAKTYFIDYVSGRALREIGPALQAYIKLNLISSKVEKGEALTPEEQNTNIPQIMDIMVRWFCVLFNNQFTPDEVYDLYPVDYVMRDIAYAITAVQTQTTKVLSEFPMTAAEKEKSL